MFITVDPAMIDYKEDLRMYGVGYHATADSIDFVERYNEEARDGLVVDIYSPCNSLDLLRSFYSEEIVGVRIHSVAFFLKHSNEDPFVMKSSGTLLRLIDAWLPEWKEERRRKHPGPETEKRIACADALHEKALAFFRKHPNSAFIPSVVLNKIIDAWRKSFFSNSSIN